MCHSGPCSQPFRCRGSAPKARALGGWDLDARPRRLNAANKVEIGRGQWESRLCMRGLGEMGLILPPSAYLGLIVPEPFEMYDESRRIIFGAARLRETK